MPKAGRSSNYHYEGLKFERENCHLSENMEIQITVETSNLPLARHSSLQDVSPIQNILVASGPS